MDEGGGGGEGKWLTYCAVRARILVAERIERSQWPTRVGQRWGDKKKEVKKEKKKEADVKMPS